MSKFNFGINESWELLEEILRKAIGDKPYDFSEIKDTWRKNKAEIIEMLDPKTARAEFELDTTIDDQEIIDLINNMTFLYREIRPWSILRYDISINEVKEGKHKSREKLGKYLAKQAENEADREEFLKQYNDLILRIKSKGKIVISANPIDIMLMSEHGIRSCHRLDGEYASAFMSFLCDSHTVVSYLTSRDRDFYYKGHEIARLPYKKWRQLIFIDMFNRGAIFSRQYPYSNDKIFRENRKNVASLLKNYFNTEENWVKSNTTNITEYNNLFYLDPLECSIYLKESGAIPEVYLDSEVYCPVCGEEALKSGEIICGSCYNSTECSNCGDFIDSSDSVLINDEVYCRYCADELFVVCYLCNEYVEEAYTYVTAEGDCVCEDCFDRDCITCEDCGSIVLEDNSHQTQDGKNICIDCYYSSYVQCAECYSVISCDEVETTADGLEICHSCKDEFYFKCQECGEIYCYSNESEINNVCESCSDESEILNPMFEEVI